MYERDCEKILIEKCYEINRAIKKSLQKPTKFFLFFISRIDIFMDNECKTFSEEEFQPDQKKYLLEN